MASEEVQRLVEEEESLPGGPGQLSPSLLDLQILNAGPGANEKPESQNKPPEPGILRAHQVGRSFHNEGPLGQGQSKSCQRSIPCSDCVTKAHEEEEADPVEEEGGDEGRAKNKIVAQESRVSDVVLPLLASSSSHGFSDHHVLQDVVAIQFVF